MGAGISTLLLGSAPDVFDAAFLVEALGLPSRDAAGSTAYLRGGVQSQHGLLGKRPKPYVNVTHAVAARSATAASCPGEQFLTYDAALPMVLRSCVAAGAAAAEGGDGAQYRRVGGAAAAAAGEHLAEEENGLPAEEQARAEWLRELADYAVSLGAAVDKNMGLDHSKVREYWLDRGPRLAATAVIFFVFAMVCQSNNQPSDSWAH